jgi:hypothetical protein
LFTIGISFERAELRRRAALDGIQTKQQGLMAGVPLL